jgi:hypothetical protein
MYARSLGCCVAWQGRIEDVNEKAGRQKVTIKACEKKEHTKSAAMKILVSWHNSKAWIVFF